MNPMEVFIKKWTYKYTKYDKQGNWIQLTAYQNNKIMIITEREIEYY